MKNKQPYPDFGKYLTYAEAVKSTTAIKKGIDNTPGAEQYANMKRLYEAVYKPLCEHFGFKLPVSSFFRSASLNKAIGGSPTSDHRNGNAIDIDCDGLPGIDNLQLFNWIRATLNFDQLILEKPDANGRPAWIHVSYRSRETNRQQVFTIFK